MEPIRLGSRDGIYYLAGTLSPTQPSPTASLEFFRPVTGERKHIATIEKPVNEPLGLSPDGQSAFYTRVERETYELMLVENFR